MYVYATLTKSGTFKSVELSNGRELSFPRKYEIISLVFYLYSLVTNVRREEGGEKNVENESIIIVAARTLITMKRVWKMC